MMNELNQNQAGQKFKKPKEFEVKLTVKEKTSGVKVEQKLKKIEEGELEDAATEVFNTVLNTVERD